VCKPNWKDVSLSRMVTSASWLTPPAKLDLGESEVHVWRASLEAGPEHYQRLEHVLSTEERAQAARFHFQRDRNHYIAGRGLLRRILAGYLGLDPAQLKFSVNAFGKPALSAWPGQPSLQFNLSHSHGLALFGVARHLQNGIDIEFIRPDFATEDIAKRFFSPREVATLLQLPAEARTEAFFNCWTRKEAFIKARGEGLSIPLNSFDVALAPGDAPALLHSAHDPEAPSRWSIQALHPGPGYAGALAVEGKGSELRCWACPIESK